MIERTNAAMRPSSPRSSRSSSTTARYSRSSSRVLPSTGSSSGCGSTSTYRLPSGSVWAAPMRPRNWPSRATARPPPGRRMCSATSATVPTEANSSPSRGTRTTRSSVPTSIASVTVMVGKTTESSTGTSSIVSVCLLMISKYRHGKSERPLCRNRGRTAPRGGRHERQMRDDGQREGGRQDGRESRVSARRQRRSAQRRAAEVAELRDRGPYRADGDPVVGGGLEAERAGGERAPAHRGHDRGEEDGGEPRAGCEGAEQGRAGGRGEAQRDQHDAGVPRDQALGEEAGGEVGGGRGGEQQGGRAS